MDYATLIAPKSTPGSIANWVNFSDAILPVASILQEAQNYIYDNLRITDMKKIATLVLPNGAASVALPTDILSMMKMQDQYLQPIKPRLLESVLDRRALDSSTGGVQSGQPTVYSMTATTFEFDMGPTSDITLTLTYFARPAMLGDGSGGTQTSNFLTDQYLHLLRPVCLAFAADFLNDDAKYNRYLARYANFLTQSMQSEEMNMFGMQADPDYTESRL